MPRRHVAPAPPGGRLFGVALVVLGLGLLAAASAPILVGAQSAASFNAHDPGPRGGAPGAGGAFTDLSQDESTFFTQSLATFQEVDAVGDGLGPRFNLDSCAGCHAQPAVGGSSPALNPQVTQAPNMAPGNTLPSFLSRNGPVREVRFVNNADGTADGGVHDLFTIAGRSDAPQGCDSRVLRQPDFATQFRNNNLIFRIPTPTFGNGMIANIPEATIIANKHANATTKQNLLISGHENREGNTGSITRFGWKAQNKSLEIFSGEAYLVEQGVSNEAFTQERGEPGDRGVAERVEPPAACVSNTTPEDHVHVAAATANADVPGDVGQFATFMRFLAPPTPAPLSFSAQRGQQTFNSIHCDMCHTPQLTTGPSDTKGLNNQPANLYSDLLVHNMGQGLSDGVTQGGAGPDEFRTAPLWGVGQRIFFLHDGRTTDIEQAIEAHASRNSEANRVIANFNNLNEFSKQDVLNFLRSL